MPLEEGFRELNRAPIGQFLSSFICGIEISFGPFLSFAIIALLGSAYKDETVQLLGAFGFAFGFILVALGRFDLFTDQTSIALLPVFSDDAEPIPLLQFWGIVFGGNIVGGLVAAGIGIATGLEVYALTANTIITDAMGYMHISPMGVLLGGATAGWLLAGLAWFVARFEGIATRVVVTALTAFVIGFTHLPFSVTSNIRIIAGMFAGAPITVWEWGWFLLLATIGNLAGSLVFIGLIYLYLTRDSTESSAASQDESTNDLSGSD